MDPTLRRMAKRLLKSATRRFVYAEKAQENPDFDKLLSLEELFYPGFYSDWMGAVVQTGNPSDPTYRDVLGKVLLTALPQACEEAGLMLDRVGLDGKKEALRYQESFQVGDFLP